MKIVIIVCYFGKLPWYFDYYLHSCSYNPDIQFHIISDDNTRDQRTFPSNVSLICKSMEDIRRVAAEKLGLAVALDHPYKFCDLRPACAYIFPELVAGYDCWGYGDLDVIYGNIRNFITPEILADYDVISVRHDYLPGMLSLFKNSPLINGLFMQSKDYVKVFTDPRHYCFDETNFSFDQFAAEIPFNEIDSEVESMTHVVRKLQAQQQLKAYFDFHVIEGLPGSLKWNKGILTYKGKFEVVLYHLIKFKNVYVPRRSVKRISDAFSISSTRIYT